MEIRRAILSETVKRLEAKVDMLIIQRADEAPDTSPGVFDGDEPNTSATA